MSRQKSFDGLAEFIAISRRQSIRGAALDLGVTPGAVSQTLQRLERRLGVSLFHRTTRKISLTEAGEALLSRIGPAAQVIESGFDEASQSSAEPGGTLRLIVERLALSHVLERVLPAFRKTWPKIQIDVTVNNNRHVDFVSEGYDAGIMIGSYIDQEMIAVRLSPPFQWGVFGSPDYFRRHGWPSRPMDLADHECIRFRRPEKEDIYRWEFLQDGQAVRIEPRGSITVNDAELMRRLAAQGLGLIYSSTFHASSEIGRGELEPALLDHSAGSDGLFLYFTKASRNQPKLRAFVEACAPLRQT